MLKVWQSMASNLGKAPVLVEFYRTRGDLYSGPAADAYRSIWYARYIDWTVTTPLLLLDLLLVTGLPSGDIFFVLFMDVLMIVGGLIGALVPSVYKWGYFVGACILRPLADL
jgi:bacteriorhodopsin